MFISVQKLNGQDFEHVFRSYGVDDGMPTSQTYKIIQDKKGYIWFGTSRGLVKYNGYEFKRYTTKDGLSTNLIFHLHADDDNTIYFVGNDNRIFSLKDDVISEFNGNSEIVDIDRNAQILSLATDEDYLHLSYWNAAGKPSHFKFKKDGTLIERNALDYGVEILDVGENMIIHCGGYNGSDKGIRLAYNSIDTVIDIKSSALFLAYIAKGENVIYFSYHKALFFIENNKIKHLKTFENTIFNLAVDQNNHLYIAFHNDGLFKYENGDLDKATQLLSDQSSISILFDENNNLWCGSSHKGLQFSALGNFTHLKLKEKVKSLDLVGDQNKLLGIIDDEKIYEISANKFTEVKQEKKAFTTKLKKEHLYRYYARNKSLLNFDKQRFEQLDFINRNLWYADKKVINDTSLYIIGRSQIILYKDDIEKTESYEIPYRLNCFEYVDNELFLIGTSNGVKIADLNKSSAPYRTYPSKYIKRDLNVEPYYIDHPFFNSSISDIIVKDNIRIFTSVELGLWIEKDSVSTWITEENGIISDNLESILYQDNYIIVSSNMGLSVVDENYNIKNYTTANGLITNEVDGFYLRNDSLWVASKMGVSLLSLKDKSSEAADVNPLILKRVRVNNREWKIKPLLRLRHLHTRLEVEYEALNYMKEGKINYKYKLDGLEDNWNYTPNRNIRYRRLPAGKFKLLISHELEDKNWTDPVVLLSVKKRIPIMIHWVFIVFYILLTIWLFMKFSLFINRRQRIKQQNLLTILELERKALQAQMNPHFMFNSLSSLKYMIMKGKKRESEDYLTKFSKFTRLTLNHSTEKFIPIGEEIELLNNYLELELTRFESKFEYEIKNRITDAKVMIPPMLIQPFIENAIIHGFEGLERTGHISIVFQSASDNTILCSVTDNGVGRNTDRKPKRHKKSFGVELVLKRLKLLHKEGDIKIVDLKNGNESAGTRVEVVLPFSK